jgi:hypothetical protein
MRFECESFLKGLQMETKFVPVPKDQLKEAVGVIRAVREFLIADSGKSVLTDRLLSIEAGLWVHATNPFELQGITE